MEIQSSGSEKSWESKSRVEKSSRIMKKFKSNRAEESLKKFKIHKFGSDKCFEK